MYNLNEEQRELIKEEYEVSDAEINGIEEIVNNIGCENEVAYYSIVSESISAKVSDQFIEETTKDEPARTDEEIVADVIVKRMEDEQSLPMYKRHISK